MIGLPKQNITKGGDLTLNKFASLNRGAYPLPFTGRGGGFVNIHAERGVVVVDPSRVVPVLRKPGSRERPALNCRGKLDGWRKHGKV